VRISIPQKDRFNLERFQAAVGGVGSITDEISRDISRYSAAGTRALWVMHLLWSHLGHAKRAQFVRALRASHERNTQ
jgi:hypothetical protein